MRSVKFFASTGTLFFFLLFSHLAHAQLSTNTLLPGYWTLGINAGKAYQSSDIRAQSNGYGFGFTLGKNLYYQPNAALSFDLRGRLLYARSFGLDAFRSYAIDQNNALNGQENLNYLNYPEATGVTKGFVYQNHRTDLGELGLEAVITLNKLKEKTGVKISLYGGAGLDYYNVKTDQADADGEEYFEEYAQINERAPTTQKLKNLKSAILDGRYETYADEFENGYGKLKFMPSVGAEIGFQVTPHFSIDFGHRLTFSGTDLLDGQQWSGAGNDLHHYTYAGLNFNINKQEKRMDPPVIRLIRPTGNSLSTRDPNLPVYATIENVNSSADVDFTVNGRPVSFNFNQEKFNTNALLALGQNELIITAQNLAGTDSKKLLIFLEDRVYVPAPPVTPAPAPIVYAPVVQITRPGIRNYTTENEKLSLEATVRNVNESRDVEVWQNGRRVNFDFDNRRDLVRAELNLWEGQNSIIVRAINSAGTAEDEVRVILEEKLYQPQVRIDKPTDRFETSKPTVNVVAATKNVDQKRDLTLLVNGRAARYFDFAADCLTATVDLVEGYNTIVVEAQNFGGTDRDEVTVIYRKPAPQLHPPTVRIVEPTDHLTVKTALQRLRANITEVVDSRDIVLTLNGREIRNFSFKNGSLEASLTLVEGNNLIRVEASNPDGNDRDEVTVIYRKPAPQLHPPTVRIVEPTDQLTVKTALQRLRANITEVVDSRDIVLTLNGREIRNFTFKNGSLEASLTLVEGNNLIRVKATNPDGSDSDEVNVRYEKGQPPVVVIAEPTNGTTVKEAIVRFKASVKNISDSRDIVLTLNGKEIRNFSFRNEWVDGTLTLIGGKNKVTLRATNQFGSDEKSVEVNFVKPLPLPEVDITQPTTGTKVAIEKVELKANLKNVNSRTDVELIVNGKPVNAFDFNTKTGMLTATVSVKAGKNELLVSGQNESGKAEDQIVVHFEVKPKTETTPETPVAAVEKPEISNLYISQPTINPMDPQRARSIVTATIKNVKSKSDVAFYVNDIAISDFTFDEKTGAFQCAFLVKQGKNTVLLRATNAAGTTEIKEVIQLGEDPGDGDSKDKMKTEKTRGKVSEPAGKDNQKTRS